jgi:hypothetical protein
MVSERCAPTPDDHPCPERRDGHGIPREQLGCFLLTAKVCRELAAHLPEPTQVDDLPDTGCRGALRHGARSAAIGVLESLAAERMDEVDEDAGPAKRSLRRCRVCRICRPPLDTAHIGSRSARDCDHLVPGAQRGSESASDDAGRP